ncbi:hypothetical protein ACS5NO_04125 [Larkinella sp. GY13]|uniref:hypothetical protein n=1 Tax=Larkinella sp. GY13 TaxID=3453720 RepID=UPI003EF0392B
MIGRIPFSQKQYIRLLWIVLLLNAVGMTLKTIWIPLTNDQLGYTLAETLMNYGFGFNRRALVGNFFILFQNRSLLLALITLAYSLCLLSPLVLIFFLRSGKEAAWSLIGAYLIFFSPFGIALYLKDPLAIRKELFFYLFFLGLVAYDVRSWPGNVAFILIGALVHDSFFFLFLPFLLGYHWLNQTATRQQRGLYFAVGTIATLLLSTLSGNSRTITEQFVEQYVALGFNRHQFAAFAYFQKLPFWTNINNARVHLTGMNPFLYLLLYVGQFGALYGLLRLFNITLTYQNRGRLLFAICGIGFMAVLLSLIAMDYGRWLAMAFGCSLLLISSQIQSVDIPSHHKSMVVRVAVGFLSVLLLLVIRIPHFTDLAFIPTEWFTVQKAFILAGLVLAALLVVLTPAWGRAFSEKGGSVGEKMS